MSKRPFIVFGLFAAICILVIPIWALGKEGDENSGAVQVASEDRDAKDMFFTNCGTCHTLAAAGTDGVVGPNLDQLLVPSGTNSAELYDGNTTRVLQAVLCGVPPGGARMPRGILEEEEAQEVAQFVGAYAGQIGKGPVIDISETPPPEFDRCPSG
jgi:mono/diheme cytochrome c family protein